MANLSLVLLLVSNKDSPTGAISIWAVCHRLMKKNDKPHNLRVMSGKGLGVFFCAVQF